MSPFLLFSIFQYTLLLVVLTSLSRFWNCLFLRLEIFLMAFLYSLLALLLVWTFASVFLSFRFSWAYGELWGGRYTFPKSKSLSIPNNSLSKQNHCTVLTRPQTFSNNKLIRLWFEVFGVSVFPAWSVPLSGVFNCWAQPFPCKLPTSRFLPSSWTPPVSLFSPLSMTSTGFSLKGSYPCWEILCWRLYCSSVFWPISVALYVNLNLVQLHVGVLLYWLPPYRITLVNGTDVPISLCIFTNTCVSASFLNCSSSLPAVLS